MDTGSQAYRPSADEPYMNPHQLDYFRRKLEAWRDELIEESEQTLEHLRTENWQEPDPNDRATHESEASLELRTRDRYRKLIGKIEAAIRRIERGEYGYCEETGEPIGLARLEARPIATLSVEAQAAHERDEHRRAD
jgi:DnaK suppressor protein